MFEAIAVIAVTLGSWGWLILGGIDLQKRMRQLRKFRSYQNMPTWYLVQTWWGNLTYTDQLCTIVAIPLAVCGFFFIAGTF